MPYSKSKEELYCDILFYLRNPTRDHAYRLGLARQLDDILELEISGDQSRRRCEVLEEFFRTATNDKPLAVELQSDATFREFEK